MCTCITEIKASYTEVMNHTEEVASWSFTMDDFLDAMNDLKKELVEVIDETDALVELVRDHFTEITVPQAEELLVLSEPIQMKMQAVYLKVLASPLYVGLVKVADLFRQAMSDFDELCHDMRSFNVNLAQDQDYLRVSQLLDDLL